MRKKTAKITAAAIFMSMIALNAAEEAALARYCAIETRGEPFVKTVTLAREMLDRLADARYPDTIAGVLEAAGYRHGAASEAELDRARWAVQLAAGVETPTPSP